MGNIFNLYLIQPIFNALIFIYNALPWQDIGLATIILTFLIRLVFYPLFHKSSKQQILMNRIQPELQKIQKEYKDDKEKQVKAQMALYKKHKVNPFGGCLFAIIQLPIILAVYRVFLNGFGSDKLDTLYHFVTRPETINSIFLGLINLSKPNIGLALITAYLQYISSKMIMPKKQPKQIEEDPKMKMASTLQKQMVFIAPVMTLVVLIPLPSILALYWSATTIFSIFQQWLIKKTIKVEDDSNKIIEQDGTNKTIN
jgi:YidC/Oxa1 family membrane protein insertase